MNFPNTIPVYGFKKGLNDQRLNFNFPERTFKVLTFVSYQDVTDGLRAFGHKVGDWPLFFNVVNAVEKESGCISAVSDRRKLGKSAGY